MGLQFPALDHNKFNELPNVDDLRPIDSCDLDCLRELRDVLERHGMLSRFGIGLLHKHFDLNAGEILIETTDFENRCQTVQPEAISATMEQASIPTLFALSTGEVVTACYLACVFTQNGHRQRHVTQGP